MVNIYIINHDKLLHVKMLIHCLYQLLRSNDIKCAVIYMRFSDNSVDNLKKNTCRTLSIQYHILKFQALQYNFDKST